MYEKSQSSVKTPAEQRGEALIRIMDRLRLNQTEMADRLGVAQSSVRRWRSGELDIGKNKLATEKLLRMAVTEAEAAPLYDALGEEFVLAIAQHPTVSKVEQVAERRNTDAWLGLIDEIADLALDGKESPPQVARLIRYWREASQDERKAVLDRAAIAEQRGKRRPARKHA